MRNPSTASPKPQAWPMAVVSGLASYLGAATIVSTGNALVMYQSGIGLAGDHVGILSAVLTLGIAVGAAVGGRLGDRFGRKPIVVGMSVALLAAMLANVFAPGFEVLLVGAILGGFGSGALLPVSLADIAEVSDDDNRGKLVGFTQSWWMLGIIVPLALTTAFGGLGRLGGQIVFGAVAVVAVATLLGRMALPESPVWLDARRAGGVPGAEPAERARVGDLLRAPYLVPFVSLLVFYSLVNLAANTGGQFGTYLWVNTAGATVEFAGMIGLVMTGVGFVLSLVFPRVVDTRWRMPSFYVGAACYVLSALIPALIGVTITTLLIWQVLAAIGGAFAFEAMMKVWTQESFGTLIRSTAQGTIISVARVLAAVLAVITPRLAAAGPQGLFMVLAILIAIGMVAAIVAFGRRGRQVTPGTADQPA